MTGKRTNRRSRSGFRDRAGAAGLLLLIALPSCDPGQRRDVSERFKHYTPEQDRQIALNDSSPNERRRAVARIAASGRTDDATFDVLDTVARRDASEQVRCVALRGLGGFADARPVQTALVILNPKGHPGEAAEAGPQVRWEAAVVLRRLVEAHLVPERDITETLDVLVGLLLHDSSRDVKMTAARALSRIEDPRVLRALIAALRNRDFGIAYEAHRSLAEITGRSYGYEAEAWEAWLASTPDPFDRAASQPTTRRPSP